MSWRWQGRATDDSDGPTSCSRGPPATGGGDVNGPEDPDKPDTLGEAGAQTPSVAPGSGRRSLDRRTLLLAAVTLIDEHDLRYLTMRRLGAHLGVEAMALYHYVHSREDLLDGIVELVIDDLY